MPSDRPRPSFAEDHELEFEYYLARELGMTVGELRRTMSMAEFIHWIAYYNREAQRQRTAELQAKGRRGRKGGM